MTMARTEMPFADVPVIGRMSPEDVLQKLHELGDELATSSLEAVRGGPPVDFLASGWRLFADKPWRHTAHAFGHLAPAPPGGTPLPIQHVGNITADTTLRNARIKIV